MSEKQISVLLVDDEEAYVNVLANRLTKRGIQVSKAYSGSEAIQSLRNHDFDVVILDLKMEGMDGLEVLKIIRTMIPDLKVEGHHADRTRIRTGCQTRCQTRCF